MQCPGQDTRYWKPDDVFEVPCQACGYSVEFFKTDGARRCPGCGERLRNPRISMGCAKWCAYAKECLGFDPNEVQLADSNDGSLTDRIIGAMKEELSGNQEQLTHALLVLNRAQDLLADEGAAAQVVLAAALLHDIGVAGAIGAAGSSDPPSREVEGASVARRLLEGIDFKDDIIEQVCRLVRSHHSAEGEETPESRVVWDAEHLVEVPGQLLELRGAQLEVAVAEVYRTPTGQRLALQMVARRQGDGDGDASFASTERKRCLKR